MTKRHNKKRGISRRFGVSLWGSSKDPFLTKNYPPGMHGKTGYKKLTDYGVQLQEKQKVKKHYGNITEKQFRNIYKEAFRRRGDTSENLVGLLESRLDAFIYRAMIVPTVFAARQFVNHKHVTVNGKIVNIPSYTLKPGDVVEVVESSKKLALVENAGVSGDRSVPVYIDMNRDKVIATYMKVPEVSEVPYPFDVKLNLITELYSR